MTTVTLSKDHELACGVVVEFEASYELSYEDQSFDHEFGTEHSASWEIQECTDFAPIEDLRYYVAQAVPRVGKRKVWRHKRALLRKQAALELAKLTDENVFDSDEVYEKAPDEPDFDVPEPDDHEPEDRYLDAMYEARTEIMDY